MAMMFQRDSQGDLKVFVIFIDVVLLSLSGFANFLRLRRWAGSGHCILLEFQFLKPLSS